MPTPVLSTAAEADAGGVRLTVPLRMGDCTAEIDIEPAHCERLFRTAAYVAVRDGCIRTDDSIAARMTAGRRDASGTLDSLATCCVELLDRHGDRVARVEFPVKVFAAFALARGLHLSQVCEQDSPVVVTYTVQAAPCPAPPLPLELPALPAVSIATLAAGATPVGVPDQDWVATFLSPDAREGIKAIDQLSRVAGTEVAGRMRTRVGFDADRRCFVRLLDQVVIAASQGATAARVVSSAASWSAFLAGNAREGTQVVSSVHSHLHLAEPDDSTMPARATAPAANGRCISIEDIVTHYTAFPDGLSAALIVSVFPAHRELAVYGYNPAALLREEPGYWLLDQPVTPTAGEPYS